MVTFDEYVSACNYPGTYDPAAVVEALKRYCKAIGVQRAITEVRRPWWQTNLLDLVLSVLQSTRTALNALDVLDARATLAARTARAALDALNARAARDARAALDALNARAARAALLIREFGNWCLCRSGWYNWDLSWIATTTFGARAHNYPQVSQWADPLLEAFVNGCWYLIWHTNTVYWVRKPTVKVETGTFGRRLHCETEAACENEVENLYFWHGILVPAYAVVAPEMISLREITEEKNEEVRRVLIERFGWGKYLRESGATVRESRTNERDLQQETLYRLADGSQRFVCADPSTGRRYTLGVPRDVVTCEQAQLFLSHGLDKFAIHRP